MIEHEGIWENGARFRRPFPVAPSTGVGMTLLITEARKQDADRYAGNPSLFRIYKDGALIREWDEVAKKYTLCLEFKPGHEFRVPARDPR